MKEKMLCFYNSGEIFSEEKKQPSFIVGTVVKHLGKMVKFIFILYTIFIIVKYI